MEDLGVKPESANLIGRKTVGGILLSFGGILLFSLVIIIGLVTVSARSQNQIALQQSRNLVNSLLKERLDQLVQLNISHSYWDEAVENLVHNFDMDWADENVGTYVFKMFGVTATHVIDGEDATSYALVQGRHNALSAEEFYQDDFAMLIKRVRETAKHNNLGITYGFTLNRGEYYLTTASILRRESSEFISDPMDVSDRILVFSKKIDTAFMTKLSQSFDLGDLQIVRNEKRALNEQISLVNIGNEDIGFLTWRVALPGNDMMLWVLPAAGGVLILYILAMIFVYRQAGDISFALNKEAHQARKFEAAYLETESRFKAFIDNTPSAIVIKDAEGRYLVANKTWNEWFNPNNLNIVGRKISDFFGKDLADRLNTDDLDVLENGESNYREHGVLTANGEALDVWSQKFAIRNGENEIVAIGTLATDISDRKVIELGLREAKHAAEMANKSKSEFMANMSHELRTPLNAILGFSDILKSESFGPMGQDNYVEYAHDIHSAGRHLLDVINEILDVAKIEAGQMTLAEQGFDVRTVLDGCQRMVGVRAKDAQIKMQLEVAQNLPHLYADETRFKQILNNLLSNAIKFTDPNGVITISAVVDEIGEMKVCVQDTGIGIKQSDIKTVLSQFGQAQSSYSRNHDGTGLGLTLVQLLADAHGADFNLESTYGEGTLVSITFPLSRTLQAA